MLLLSAFETLVLLIWLLPCFSPDYRLIKLNSVRPRQPSFELHILGLKEIPLLLCFVAQILTFNNETKNWTLINTISYGHRRRTVVLSKILVGLFYLLTGFLC